MYGLEHRISRLISELKEALVLQSRKIEAMEIRRGTLSFPCAADQITDGFQPFAYGDLWSEPEFNNYALFRFEVKIPASYAGRRAVLQVKTNQGGGHNMIRPQMLLFLDGTPVQGLDTNHEQVLLSDCAQGGKTYSVHIYAFSGMPGRSPYGDQVDVKAAEGVRLYADLQLTDARREDYYYNLKVPYGYLKHFDKNSYAYQTILHSLNDSVSLLDLRDPLSEACQESIESANDLLKKTLYSGAYPTSGKATLIGHTHIDLAWLWQYRHTRDKVMRSFATAVKLLNEQEDHRFMSSQAQLYQFLKESQPELYREIQALVKEGRWEAEGAMWVEPDMNLSSGESIVRQILYGKRFFREEFGHDCKVLWLPDVFGYSAALPQILKKSGVPYFMTSKLAANELNRFPHDTFLWKGIDGTELFSHLLSYLPSAYAPNIEEGEILEGWRNYAQKAINDDILVPFGWSDGGGGPTTEQIETVKRLAQGLPGLPKAKFGKAEDYFQTLEARVAGNKKLPVWSGELYFEKHRGTYTSMARMKKQNRRAEFLYSNAEWLWSLARQFGGGDFPKARFDTGMKHLLLNQFHDVLPGFSIKEVYDDADALYREAFAIGQDICRQAVAHLSQRLGAEEPAMVVFNPHGEPASGYVELDDKVHFVKNIPAKGYALCPLADTAPEYPVTACQTHVENRYYAVTLSENGGILSLWDKEARRQCFLPGQEANRLRVFEDKPLCEDNWNLDRFYTEREFPIPAPSEVTVLETGGHRGIVRFVRNYAHSRITQDIILYADSPRIDFRTEIDWKDHSQVLRVDFPVDVNAVKATYEIQFGHLERPSTRNTTWEDAKFEVCGHKWADISDGGYGMALLNDCKYGYSTEGSTLSMTLLRSGNVPNPEADKELHTFTYSILPHKGHFADAGVIQEAYLLNNPLFAAALPGGGKAELPARFSLFDCQGAVLETVKPAEDGKGLILRLYEARNRSGLVKVTCGCPVKKATLCDLLEQPAEGAPLTCDGKTVEFPIKPFEIVTLRIQSQ